MHLIELTFESNSQIDNDLSGLVFKSVAEEQTVALVFSGMCLYIHPLCVRDVEIKSGVRRIVWRGFSVQRPYDHAEVVQIDTFAYPHVMINLRFEPDKVNGFDESSNYYITETEYSD